MNLLFLRGGVVGAVAAVLAACQPVPPASQSVAAPNPAVTVADTASVAAFASPVVDASFGRGGGSWDGNGGILFRYTVVDQNGEIYICGAYARKGSGARIRLGREVMRRAALVVNGNVITRNMTHFNAVSSANWDSRLVGVETNCRTTGLAAGSVPKSAFSIQTFDGSYRIRR